MTVDELRLLPRPRQLISAGGAFAIDAATPIVTGAVPDEHTRHTARGLQTSLADLLGFSPPIVAAEAGPRDGAISLVLTGDDATGQSYTLEIGERGVVVAASAAAGLFYGVQTLIQIAKSAARVWPALRIADAPVLPVRGLMLDVSRGRVPTRETLFGLVRTLAHYKYNHLQLYVEHTFLFPRHPEIGASAGALTPEDIVALDAVCHAHHVELVPNLQSFGHHLAMLKLPRYEQLAETAWKWSLATARDETFALLDELYGDLLPCFSSRWFNVGADEPWDMGLGQSRELTRSEGIGRVYLRHVRRLHELVTKRGHRMMMWADVLKLHPELMGELPDDVLLLDWSYESQPRYETLDALAASGRPFWVCPATSSWTTLYPRLENAVANTRDYVCQGIGAGAGGMLLTEWGDGGHYQTPSNSWYPYLWGAEVGWSGGETDRDDFEVAFDRLFLGDGSGTVTAAIRRLGATTQTAPDWLTTWNTAMALFEEPLAGTLCEIAPVETVAATRDAAVALLPLLGRVRDSKIRHDLGFTVAELRFATEKIETTRAVRALLAELGGEAGPTDGGRRRFDALLAAMRRQRDALPALVQEFEARWLAHSRPSEIRINLDRFAALLAQYDVALAWLEGQRAAYERGERVDGSLATYDRGGYAVLHEATRRWLMDLVAIVGYEALPQDLKEWLGPAAQSLDSRFTDDA
ncbi:MAG TPA: glycoside hydrolase family 20 zincin-like fold domain-containing protein [Thermomicrobiales bacterium]